MDITITSFLSADHKKCDTYFAQAECDAAARSWTQAADKLDHFGRELEHHMAMEEQVLFPAFEHATGNSTGPTAVMRIEHAQMRALLNELRDAVVAQDGDTYAGHADTFNTMLQQHNLKEENILYRMTDRLLDAAETVASMRGLHAHPTGA
jgi:iron-sulfur cluster repair protein YtfE (RIC family)